jgi:hypothetical protein
MPRRLHPPVQGARDQAERAAEEVKARINPVKHWWYKVYWWWTTRWYELDPEQVSTFFDWANIQDIHLATYRVVQDPDNPEDHEHVLYPLGMEETEAILERYLSWKANRCQVNKLPEPR